MKKFVLFLFSMCILSISGFAQQNNKVTLHFAEKEFLFKCDDKGWFYIISKKYPITYQTDKDEPALPFVRINYLIGNRETFRDVSLQSTDTLIYSDVIIVPNPEYQEANTAHISRLELNTDVYKKDLFPDHNVEYTGTHIMGGYKYISFLVCPFSYDTHTKNVYLKKDIELTINTVSSLSDEGKDTDSFKDNNILSTLKGIIINSEDIEKICDGVSKKGTGRREGSLSSSSDYEYLIVTNNALKSAFLNMTDWKTMKGIKSKILTTEEIVNQYSGTSLDQKIKLALKDYYNGTYSGLKYVLLGGDTNIVPSRMCYIRYNKNDSVYSEESTPTDMYYACFDGNFEWDANGNGIYGELDDSVDLAPEIVVTRVPVRTLNEASSIVDMLVNYERNPIATNWQKSLLMGGNVLKYWYQDHSSDAEIKADNFYDQVIQPYWDGDRYKLFNTFSGDSAYIFNPTVLQEKLSEGHSFVDITTHGQYSSWAMRDQTYDIENAQQLVNQGRTLITTVSCLTNGFDEQTCLSEAFVRNNNSGIIGYLGCSRQGWFYTWPWSLGPSFDYNGEFYIGLFNNSHKKYGQTVTEAKTQFVGSCLSYNTPFRWIMFGLNPIGDPEQPLYTNNPQRFDDLKITLSNGNLNVITGTSNCTICVSGTNYYEVSNGATASFSNVLDGCKVCVTKPGYIPIVATVRDVVYLQNISITDNTYIATNDLYAGSDVTASVPQGNVIIQNGNMEIYGTNGVTIKNDFEVKLGASLKISMGN